MKQSENNQYQQSPVGYALHKVIYNEFNRPIDYQFMDANRAFFDMTGFTEEILGKTLLEVVPSIVDDDTNWIEIYGDIASECTTLALESYSKTLAKWYFIHAYAPEKGYFITLLTPVIDSTTSIASDTNLKLNLYRNESLIRVMSNQSTSIAAFLDYALLEAINLTQSDIGYIALYDEEKEEFTLNSWSNKVMEACTITEKQTLYHLEKTGFWGEVVRQKKAIINNDFVAPHHLKKGVPQGHAPLLKFMSIPVYDRNKIVAVIGLANKPEDYTETDVRQIQLFMEDVWMVSKRKQAELELEYEKENLRVVIDSISDGIISVDSDLTVITANSHALSLLSRTLDQIRHLNIFETLLNFNFELKEYLERKFLGITRETKERIGAEDIISDTLQSEPYNNHDGIIVNNADQVFYIIVENVVQNKRVNKGFVVVLREVTGEYKHTEQIHYMSYHDNLTGLYNRRFFEEELKRLDIARSLPMSIIMGDVNGLKLTNDAFGHFIGDRLLINVAQILQESCRKGEIIARWGGDEFIILLPNTTTIRAQSICKTITALCKQNKENVIDVSISLGHSTKNGAHEDIFKVITLAEDIMYKNKLSEGKSQRSSIVEAIKKTLYERNHETEEHAERIIQYCMLMADKLGLSEEDKADMRLFAMLHDIGKIGIADHILLKPSQLTEDEWYEMRKHPVIGYRIATSSVDLQHIAYYILHHHERWDGTGYPDKLAGDNIPLLARILAIADAYDAMTSDRPYRNKMQKEDALKELKSNAGRQFDKALVSVFTKYIG